MNKEHTIWSSRVLRHFRFLQNNGERGILPIEIRIPVDEFEELSQEDKEHCKNLMIKYPTVNYKWI